MMFLVNLSWLGNSIFSQKKIHTHTHTCTHEKIVVNNYISFKDP